MRKKEIAVSFILLFVLWLVYLVENSTIGESTVILDSKNSLYYVTFALLILSLFSFYLLVKWHFMASFAKGIKEIDIPKKGEKYFSVETILRFRKGKLKSVIPKINTTK